APLPGGERRDIGVLAQELRAARPWLSEATATRLARNYGTRAVQLLGAAASLQHLGEHFGADLYQAEVDYLRAHEWVTQADDLLWRRSKLGLRIDAAGR
ncbi:glycerol-3-phosphate dehydrogenase C-terminal domain-containing protein, partial [Xanthomonas translucens]